MTINPSDPLVEIKITSAICSAVAIATTLYRLYIRYERYWLDDLWATFALLTLAIQIVSVFLHLPVPNSLSQTTRVAAYYLMAYTFYAVIWASRLSILFSLVRIDHNEKRRKALHWVAVAFMVAAVFLMAQLLWVCEPEPQWKKAANPQCRLPQQVAIAQLVTDVLADLTLLFVPLRLFRSLQSRALRKKLSIIFSTCVATTIVSLVHAAFIFQNGGIKIIVAALVEDCVSLIVANLPVVAAHSVSLEEEDHVDTYTGLSFNKSSHTTSTVSTLGTSAPILKAGKIDHINLVPARTSASDLGVVDGHNDPIELESGLGLGRGRGRGNSMLKSGADSIHSQEPDIAKTKGITS